MRKRFHKRSTDKHTEESRRFPMGLLFTVLAILVLLAVLGYDRHEQNEAKDQAEFAGELLNAGKIQEAVAEYKRALENPRLNKRGRASIAVKLANVYFDHVGDYGLASLYYGKAKQWWPASLQASDVQNRMRLAQQRTGTGSIQQTAQQPSTTASTAQVQLIAPPADDASGPVIARIGAKSLHAGELNRMLHRLPDAEAQATRRSPDKMEQFVRRNAERAMLYQAALDAQLHQSPDLPGVLYEYQRDLLSRRLEQSHRGAAEIVSSAEVAAFYEKNRARFMTSGSVTLAMIKLATREAAAAASEQLQKGARFEDTASSQSVDKVSAAIGGAVGTLLDGQAAVPGVGINPDLARQLLSLETNSITRVIESNGSYYIFKVLRRVPGVVRPLDDVRTQIESTIRTEKTREAQRLMSELREKYRLTIDQNAVSELLDDDVRLAFQGKSAATTSTQVESVP